jgi:hypothetical protein
MTTVMEWLFPLDDSDDPELGCAVGHRTMRARQRETTTPSGPMRYVIGDDGALVILESHLPILRAFLRAFDKAPQGSDFVNCVRCECRAIWIGAELRGTDNTGNRCDDHDCHHGTWNTRHDARCRFCGEQIAPEREGVDARWLCVYENDPYFCRHSPDLLHKSAS